MRQTRVEDSWNIGSLLLAFAAVLGLCLALNAIVFGLGWDDEVDPTVWFAPPGYVVGIVWQFLFGAMAFAYWRLRSFGDAASSVRRTVIFLIIFCAAYPLYTIGLSSLVLGLLGNIATFIVTAYAIKKAWPFSKIAALVMSPILVWLIFATAIVLGELGLI